MGRHFAPKPVKEYRPVRVPTTHFKLCLVSSLAPIAGLGVVATLLVGAVTVPVVVHDLAAPPVEPRTPTAITEPASRFPLPLVRLPKHIVEVAQVEALPAPDVRVAEIHRNGGHLAGKGTEGRGMAGEPARRDQPSVPPPPHYVGRHRAPCPPGQTPPVTPTDPTTGGEGTPAPGDDTTSAPGASRPHHVRDLIKRITERHKTESDSGHDSDSDRGRSGGRGHNDRPERGHGDGEHHRHSGGDREGGGHHSGGGSHSSHSDHSSSHGGGHSSHSKGGKK